MKSLVSEVIWFWNKGYNKKMIEIALGKWGYFHQIIFNANKTSFEILFYSYYFKSYDTQALVIGARSQLGYIINRKLEM